MAETKGAPVYGDKCDVFVDVSTQAKQHCFPYPVYIREDAYNELIPVIEGTRPAEAYYNLESFLLGLSDAVLGVIVRLDSMR